MTLIKFQLIRRSNICGRTVMLILIIYTRYLNATFGCENGMEGCVRYGTLFKQCKFDYNVKYGPVKMLKILNLLFRIRLWSYN